jgi:hypothetical protein
VKTNQSGNPDKALHKMLQEWRTEASLPPGFQEAVWRRIERVQARAAHSVWAAICHWIETVMPRPALAVSYVAMLLTIGVTAGWAQAHKASSLIKDELGQRYVRELDPYQAPRE